MHSLVTGNQPQIHAEVIRRFGGSSGIRDQTLLESALAGPQVTIGGKSPFHDLIEVAAAYLFYLVSNHPFVDGNKRVGLGACLVFLKMNGLIPLPDNPEWESLTLSVAAGELSRDQTSEKLRRLVRSQ